LGSIVAFNSLAGWSAYMGDGFPGSPYFELLRDEIPHSFLVKLQQKSRFIYEEAFGRAFHDPLLPRSEAKDLYPHIRRALFEAQLDAIASETGMVCETRTTKRGTAHYRVVRVGRILITASAVHSPHDKPRPAAFRQDTADLNQLQLFPPSNALVSPVELKSKSVYVVIVHGPHLSALNEPGFIGFGVPREDWRRWLEMVPLTTLLDAQKERERSERESIIDNVQPKKRDKKQENDGQ
jgi:hypothetical protein